ncbi:MAG TPA: hypothetical protein DIC60_04355 [Lachnospiraceae bacterium]|nr:hypothetical protein [Lachnospiraceae bacterium]
MATNIKVYRGNQIGGCVVIVNTDTTRICIDMVENLPGNETAEELEIKGLTYEEENFEAVFFTHYYGDHIGELQRILPNIPCQ